MKRSEAKCGMKVKDKITGFEGIMTSITEHINGCVQCGVTPRVIKKGEFPESVDIDIETLEESGRKKVIKKSPTGGRSRTVKRSVGY